MKIKFSKDDTLAIKGVALLFMLHHHCFCQYERFQEYDVSFFPFNAQSVVNIAAFFKICVGMFAFLSAYGLTVSLKKYSPDTCLSGSQFADYFKNRYIKLMWGYWFAVAAVCILTALIKPSYFSVYFSSNDIYSGVHTAVYAIYDILGLSCLMGTPTLNSTWWYMSLAIAIVMLVPLTAKSMKKNGAALTLMMFIFIPRLVCTGNDFKIGQSTNIVRWCFSVFLGVAAAQNDLPARLKAFKISSNKIINKLLKFLIATAVLILLYNLYRTLGGKFANYCYEFRDCFIPVFVIYYFYDFIIDIPILRDILMFVGKHSMNIFFTHTFIRVHFFKDFTYSFGNWFMIDLVLLLDSMAVSIIMELIKKYTGYNKLLSKALEFPSNKKAKKVG